MNVLPLLSAFDIASPYPWDSKYQAPAYDGFMGTIALLVIVVVMLALVAAACVLIYLAIRKR
jgi:hypothetical protein